jgi:outer membrane protein assembly factor BamA
MSLPVTAQSASNVPLGVGYSSISGTAATLQVYANNATTVQLTAVFANATYANLQGYTASIPGPWGTGSFMSFGLTYEAA